MASKQPSFQFYPGDWLKDPALASVSHAAKGLWIDMLCLMFEGARKGYLQVNSQAPSVEQLARMLRADADGVRLLIEELEDAGIFSRDRSGIIFSRRLVRDAELSHKRAKAGKNGGNPAFVKGASNPYYSGKDKQNDNQLHKQADKQKITPSSSSSSSPSGNKEAKASSRDFDFAAFWDAYGKKSDKTKCEKAWAKLTEPDKERIMHALPGYVSTTPEIKFRKNPFTWLNGRCWEDEPGDTTDENQSVTDPQDKSKTYYRRDYPNWHPDAPFDFGNIRRYENNYPLRDAQNENIPGSNDIRP